MKRYRNIPWLFVLFALCTLTLAACGGGSPGETTETVAKPTFDPAPGNYTTAQFITLSTTTAGASIYYTTNGTTPSATNGVLYSAPVPLGASATIKVVACKTGSNDSAMASGVYTITLPPSTCAAPDFSPPPGSYTTAQSITLNTATVGASIRYTVDGTVPSSTIGTLYTAPIPLGTSTTIMAVTYQPGWIDSPVATGVYTITLPPSQCAAPEFDPTPGSYNSAQSITLYSATAGASIRYTTDGSTPSATSGILFTAPIPLGTSATIKAVTYQPGWIDSPVSTGVYTITLPPDNTTTNIMLSSGYAVLTFINNALVHRIDSSGPVQTYTYAEPAGSNKLILLANTYTAGSRPLSLTDATGNNVYNIQAAGVLNITDYANGSYVGKMETNAFGSGWTSAYEAPLSIGVTAWNLHYEVYDSHYDNGAVYLPVGTASNEVRTLAQDGFQVTYGSSLFSLCYGTVNKDLVYFWSWGGNDPTWRRTRSETWVVDASGTTLTGTMEETWQARSGSTTAYARYIVTGWK